MADDMEFVSILVPRRYVTQVYGFISSLDNPTADVRQVRVEIDEAPAPLGKDWPRDLIVRQYVESPPTMKKFQRYLADHPGEDFSSTEIAEAIGAERGWNTIAGALGAYGRRVKNRYKRSKFPFQQEWDHQNGEMRHSMTNEVAEIIREL